MKKAIFSFLAIIVLSIALVFSVNAQTNDNIQITLPTFRVTLNGNVIDSVNSQYPLIIYNDITYFPMTYNDSRLLGIESNYTLESGLEIFSGTTSLIAYQPYNTDFPNRSTYTATLPSFQIRVNGKSIDNSTELYPLLVFRDITYFPLTWRFAHEEFGWNYSFDLSNGLVISSNKKTDVDLNDSSTSIIFSSQEIYSKCSPAVFLINVTDCDNLPLSLGSGFFLTSSGIAVTNYHVLEGGLGATITTTAGNTYGIEGILDYSKENDYCIIKVAGSGFTSLKIGDSSKICGGEKVYAIGNPQGLTNTISDGIVSNPRRDDFSGMMQISTPISPGSSGGALINEQCEVIGITTAGMTSGQNLNFAIPINYVISSEHIENFYANKKLLSYSEFATIVEYDIYKNIPGAFMHKINESEPNNDLNTISYIDNGTTIYGIIDDDFTDSFLIRCNTPGTIKIPLFSESSAMNVKDLTFGVRPVNSTKIEGALSDFLIFEDASAGRQIRYKVYSPGTYFIDIFRNNSNYITDYEFYYEFIPGDFSIDNSLGDEYDFRTYSNAYEKLIIYLKENGKYESEINAYTLSFSNDNGVSVYIHYDLTYSWIVFRSICTFTGGETVSTYVYVDEIGTKYPFSIYYYPRNSSSPSIEASGIINAKDFPTYDTLKINSLNVASNEQADGFDDLCSASVSDLLRNMDLFLEYHTTVLTMEDFGFESYKSYSITENTSIYEVQSSPYRILEDFIKSKGKYNSSNNAYDYEYTSGSTSYYMHYDIQMDAILLRNIVRNSYTTVTYIVLYENSIICDYYSNRYNPSTGATLYKATGTINANTFNTVTALNYETFEGSFGYQKTNVYLMIDDEIYKILMFAHNTFTNNNLGISIRDFGFNKI